MFLEKLILLNWGQMEHGEYPLGQVTLFTGGTAAGKTTMSDAIQTLLTAAKDGLFTYNPAQDEATQRSREKKPRTLQSYILGADQNEYLRPFPVFGYLAGVFVPSPGESAKPFSAVIGVEAHLDIQRTATAVVRTAVLDDLQLFTLEGVRVSLGAIAKFSSPERIELWPVTEIFTNLKLKFGNAVVSHGNNKRAYLERLYGLLKGASASSTEAEQAAKSFSRFMAYKALDNVNDFVRLQVLDAHDLTGEVAKISNLLQDVTGIREEVERIGKNLEALHKCQNSGTGFLAAWGERLSYVFCREWKKRHALREALKRSRAQLAAGEKEQQGLKTELGNLEKEKVHLEEQQLLAQDQRRQNQAAVQKDLLDSQLARIRDATPGILQALAEEHIKLSGGHRLIQQLGKLPPEAAEVAELAGLAGIQFQLIVDSSSVDTRALGVTISQLAEKPEPDPTLAAALLELVAGLDRQTRQIKSSLTDAENNPYACATQALSRLSHELDENEIASKKLRTSIAKLAQGQITYLSGTQEAKDLVLRQFSQAKPRVLCDLIEPRDEAWQAPIEAYMGDTRYSLIVEPEFEARARHLITRVLGQNAVGVVQGALAQSDAEHVSLPVSSIVHSLDIADPIAKAYVTAQYGLVEQVTDAAQLPETRQGVTLTGLASANYRMLSLNVGESLTFGQKARERTKLQQEQQLRQLVAAKERLSNHRRVASQVQLLTTSYQPASMEQAASELHKMARDIADIQQKMALLDLTDVEKLNKILEQLKLDLSELGKKRSGADRRMGELDVSINNWNGAIQRDERLLEQAEPAVLLARSALVAMAAFDDKMALERVQAEAIAAAEDDTLAVDELDTRIADAGERAGRHKLQFKRDISAYNGGGARGSEQIAIRQENLEEPEGKPEVVMALVDGLKQVSRQIHAQTDFGLAEKEVQLKAQWSAFYTTFTTDFCQLIYTSVRKGQDAIKALNRQLKEKHFGGESYRFEAHFVPGMKQYFDLFAAIALTDEPSETKDIFGEGSLSPELKPVLDELAKYLLDGTSDAANKKLAELADYRNYHRYEIWKDVPDRQPVALSTYGTASGGQFETPAYVIRLAAVSSAFRLNERNPAHLKVLVTDEAFGRMDEARARAILRHITQDMGFQVIFIVPNTRSAVFLDQVSHQYMFAKVPAPASQGELKHQIIVQWQEMNKDTLPDLWREHRERVVQQAIFEFDSARPG